MACKCPSNQVAYDHFAKLITRSRPHESHFKKAAGKAMRSIKLYPLPISTFDEAMQLEGVGKTLAAQIMIAFGHESTSVENTTSTATTVTKKDELTKSKTYIPESGKAPWCIVLVIYQLGCNANKQILKESTSAFITRHDLPCKNFRQAWAATIKALVSKEILVVQGSDVIALTSIGVVVAETIYRNWVVGGGGECTVAQVVLKRPVEQPQAPQSPDTHSESAAVRACRRSTPSWVGGSSSSSSSHHRHPVSATDTTVAANDDHPNRDPCHCNNTTSSSSYHYSSMVDNMDDVYGDAYEDVYGGDDYCAGDDHSAGDGSSDDECERHVETEGDEPEQQYSDDGDIAVSTSCGSTFGGCEKRLDFSATAAVRTVTNMVVIDCDEDEDEDGDESDDSDDMHAVLKESVMDAFIDETRATTPTHFTAADSSARVQEFVPFQTHLNGVDLNSASSASRAPSVFSRIRDDVLSCASEGSNSCRHVLPLNGTTGLPSEVAVPDTRAVRSTKALPTKPRAHDVIELLDSPSPVRLQRPRLVQQSEFAAYQYTENTVTVHMSDTGGAASHRTSSVIVEESATVSVSAAAPGPKLAPSCGVDIRGDYIIEDEDEDEENNDTDDEVLVEPCSARMQPRSPPCIDLSQGCDDNDDFQHRYSNDMMNFGEAILNYSGGRSSQERNHLADELHGLEVAEETEVAEVEVMHSQSHRHRQRPQSERTVVVLDGDGGSGGSRINSSSNNSTNNSGSGSKSGSDTCVLSLFERLRQKQMELENTSSAKKRRQERELAAAVGAAMVVRMTETDATGICGVSAGVAATGHSAPGAHNAVVPFAAVPPTIDGTGAGESCAAVAIAVPNKSITASTKKTTTVAATTVPPSSSSTATFLSSLRRSQTLDGHGTAVRSSSVHTASASFSTSSASSLQVKSAQLHRSLSTTSYTSLTNLTATATVSAGTAAVRHQDYTSLPYHLTVEREMVPLGLGVEYEVVLVVDKREQNNAIVVSKMVELNIPCELSTLAVGDFLWIARPKQAACGELTSTISTSNSSSSSGNSAGAFLPRAGQEVLISEESCESVPGLDAGMAVDRRDLNAVVLDVIAERKSISDLASSIVDQRYEEQKSRMKTCGVRSCVYIIEGEIVLSVKQKHITPQAIKTCISATHAGGNMHVLRTRSLDHTISSLQALHWQVVRRFRKGACGDTFQTFRNFQRLWGKRSASDYRQLFGHQLRQIQGCSKYVALALMREYGTTSNFVKQLELMGKLTAVSRIADLRRVGSARSDSGADKRIGPALALRIWNVYAETY